MIYIRMKNKDTSNLTAILLQVDLWLLAMPVVHSSHVKEDEIRDMLLSHLLIFSQGDYLQMNRSFSMLK